MLISSNRVGQPVDRYESNTIIKLNGLWRSIQEISQNDEIQEQFVSSSFQFDSSNQPGWQVGSFLSPIQYEKAELKQIGLCPSAVLGSQHVRAKWQFSSIPHQSATPLVETLVTSHSYWDLNRGHDTFCYPNEKLRGHSLPYPLLPINKFHSSYL